MAHQTTSRTARNMLSSLGLISVLILAGCGSNSSGGDGQDGQTTTPSAETSTTTGIDEYVPASADGPAQNVPVPELPDAAREQTEEGAEATLEYWWDAFGYLYLTGDAAPLTEVSGESCVFCENFVELIPQMYDEQGWFVLEDSYRIESFEADVLEPNRKVIFEQNLVQPKSEYFDQDGTRIEEESTEGADIHLKTLIGYSSERGQWTVLESTVVQEADSDGV